MIIKDGLPANKLKFYFRHQIARIRREQLVKLRKERQPTYFDLVKKAQEVTMEHMDDDNETDYNKI